MAVYDIILDDSGELLDSNGDFKAGNNDNNIIRYIVVAHKGEYKEFPLLGVGIEQYLNSTANISTIAREIKNQLKSDVFSSPLVDISGFPDTIKIEKDIYSLNG
jgi:hypothetical protein